MNLHDKRLWLEKHGNSVKTKWGAQVRITWYPIDDSSKHVETCYGYNQDELYGTIYNNVKDYLYHRCE